MKKIVATFLLIIALVGCSYDGSPNQNYYSDAESSITDTNQSPSSANAENSDSKSATQAAAKGSSSKERLTVSFIDVGQGDSILVTCGSKSMLIDAGNSSSGDTVSTYINSKSIKKLNYVIVTHPHEDHIGGMDEVIESFGVGKVIMPRTQTNTKTFENLLLAISAKGLKATAPKVGDEYSLGSAKFVILAPTGSHENLNDDSVVIRLIFGKTSFLLTGDAGSDSENELLTSGLTLKSSVLKVGHHGSKYSTSSSFLGEVSPKYAVISVGSGNNYGHPASETVSRLSASNIKIYRTDLNGTIVAVSDGQKIKFSVKSSPAKAQGPPAVSSSQNSSSNDSRIVYITNSGEKYHRDGCRYLRSSKIKVTLKEAKARGLTPCSVCDP